MEVSGEVVAPGPHGRRRRSASRLLRDLALIFIVAILVSFLIKTFVVRSFYIPSASMEQTLMIDDRILVDEITPKISGIHRGDIVVFVDPGGWLVPQLTPFQASNPLTTALTFIGLSAGDSNDHLIKRVIGLAGDHVSCCNALGQMTVNGTPLKEPYLNLPPGQAEASLRPFSITVPKGSLWVMGDNRDNSADSRAHLARPGSPYVPIENVVGKAFAITWPTHRWSWLSSHPDSFAGVPPSQIESSTTH